MKTKQLLRVTWSIVAIICVSMLMSVPALAQGKGKGGGGGGGGTGDGGTTPDLGDLFVLYRDAGGVPILTPDSCQQPLAAPGVNLPAVGTIPACTPGPTASCIIPVDPAVCTVVPGYESYTQEVDFGRTSVVRSPSSVLLQQLDDVVVNLATADCVSLDPAGRLVASRVSGDVVTATEVDSPLQNLAVYYQLMQTGYLGAASAPLVLPSGPFDTAARGLGAAADKTGKVTVDMVVYLNQILGLTSETVPTVLPKRCISVKEEVKGVVQLVRKCFLDFAAYNYNRGANFGALPNPPYIPAGAGIAGWFEHLAVLDLTGPTFNIANGAILASVPELASAPAWTGANIGAFAQASDDARAVINFMHDWPVPVGFPTPLTCTASGAVHYDVSISPESGLQVPVRMVAGTEGREFTVTVANAGPDAATGTVVVTAIDSAGVPIPTFPRSYPFTILAGASQAWTEGFSINTVTTITWTATANATLDVNLGNNTVSATTTVTKKGGGRK